MSRPEDDGFAWQAVHVLALSAVAVAQPLFDLLGRNPEFFVAHRAGGADVVLVMGALLLIVPGALVAAAGLAALAGRRARRWTLGAIIALLVALLTLQVLKRVAVLGTMPGPAAAAMVVLATSAGIAAALAYLRLRPLRTFASFLAVGLLLFPVLLASQTPIARLIFGQSGGARSTESGRDTGRAGGAATGGPTGTASDGDATPEDGAARRVLDRTPAAPVVLVIFDQLPLSSLLDADKRIDPELYPGFAALAEDATWYREATAVGNKTAWAIPPIVTGRYPDPSKRLPSWLDYPDNLLTLVAPAYTMRVFEPLTDFCPDEICDTPRQALPFRVRSELADLAVVYAHVVAPLQWASLLPPLSQDWAHFGASPTERLRAEFEEWREGRRRWSFTERWVARRDADRLAGPEALVASISSWDPQPAFYFAHLLLPHEPFIYLPSGRAHTIAAETPGLRPDGRWVDDRRLVARAYRRHLLQVGAVDRWLAGLLAKLKDEGLYDPALVVVAADHGASFAPGLKFKDPAGANAADIMSIPLLIKAPHQTVGVIDDRGVELVDVLPTMAALLGIEVPWEMDGRSLAGEGGSGRPDGGSRGPAGAGIREEAPRPRTIFYGAAHGRFVYEAEQMAAKYDTVARKLRLFGADGDPLPPDPLAPHGELVGRRLGEVGAGASGTRGGEQGPSETEVEEGVQVEVELDSEDAYANVDPDSGFVPAHVSGPVAGGSGSVDLAIAVNGVVRATVRSTPLPSEPGYGNWSVIVPETAFVAGANVIEVFVIDDTAGEPVLRRVYRGPPAPEG